MVKNDCKNLNRIIWTVFEKFEISIERSGEKMVRVHKWSKTCRESEKNTWDKNTTKHLIIPKFVTSLIHNFQTKPINFLTVEQELYLDYI